MPEETTTEFLDAEQFKNRLIARINANDEEGRKIAKYLYNVVPNWWTMRPTRLYKHIQKMLGNAEGIRRFEIDLIWKRVVYVISLIVISFTAFGGVFYMINDTGYGSWDIKMECTQTEKTFLFFVLFLIALTNAFLSFCLAKMNVASHRWQRNWEYHVDYLQTILEVKMIRANLKNMPKYFTIGRTNILISIFMFTTWSLITIAIGVWIANFFFDLWNFFKFDSWSVGGFKITKIVTIIVIIIFSAAILLLPFLVYRYFTGEKFCKKCNANEEVMHIKSLQALRYTRRIKALPIKINDDSVSSAES